MGGIQALAAAVKGLQSVTQAVTDPEKAGKGLAETLLTAIGVSSAQPLGNVSMNNSPIDFRAKHLGTDV